MTEAEFIQIHNSQVTGNINFPLQINVNIEDSLPNSGWNPITSTTGYITGVTVTTNAKYVDDEYDVSIREVLQQVERIRFFFNNIECTLNILTRSFFANNDPILINNTSSPEGASYFYFKVEPFELPSNTLTYPALQDDVVIDFSPFLTDIQFAFNNYNVLINNATQIRLSEVIVECDRNETQAIPDNFNPIYSGSALNANVQDSYYSSISWKNSRYDGAKSTPLNYAGVTPSLSGRAFTGEIFPSDAFNDTVCLTPTDSRVLEELFHNGINTLPKYETYNIGPTLALNISPIVDTLIPLTTTSPITGSIDPGDILIVNLGELNEEKMRVIEYFPNPIPPATTPYIRVQRGYAGTSANQTHNSADTIHKVRRTDLFRFGSSDTRITSAVNSIIYVKDSNQALYTDDFGTVYSGSVCPDTLLLGVDNPDPQ